MPTWQNTRTGEVAELPEASADASGAEAALARRMAAALDRSARWERITLPPAVRPRTATADKVSQSAGDDVEPPADLTSWTLTQLRAEAARRGVPTYGTKAQITERLYI
ncbi:SAP domain-containing protein [Spirillospora sp. NBC_01491]|uniref:SAP domain-containing protein n=1 Tax=Spirillospora sp. NBC_01491 TaxID=2976007 RepID=UPI002E336BB5|nr:SAP domain-containing protein [Spirillospora sp. NBC_01491]